MNKEFRILWKNKKGKSFEDLVYALLKCMFPDIIFKQTDYVHDGGKDFYSVGNIREEKIWVEAKNYNNHLELSKFSNTFIMADISEVNRILIFSMSEVTRGAKINIARYATYNNKSISVYAGKDVFFLLNKYRNDITISDYIDNEEELFCMFAEYEDPFFMINVTHEYYRTKQFNLTYRRNKENHIKKNELASLPINSLIAQEVHITNSDLFQSKRVKLDFSEYHNTSIETYFYKTEPEYIIIPPSSTYIIVIFFKYTSNCRKIKLPSIHFDNFEVLVESETCQTECCWLGEIPYMGKGWELLQNTIHSMNTTTNKNVVLVEGKSGVGKTRFLTELSGYFFQNAHRIICLDFRSLTSLSLKSILQNILNNIYVLDEESSENVVFMDSFGEKYHDFYDIMYNDSYNCEAHIDKLSMLFLWLFQKKRILLSLDNVQDINADTVAFFERLLSNINNQTEMISTIVLSFNMDFLYREKAAFRLLYYVKQLNATYCVELTDFSSDDARIYLRECLDPRGLRSDLNLYYDEIIKNFGTNPFVLKQVMIYLKQRGIISFVDSMVCVTDFSNMKIVLSELPKGINQILHYRYYCLLNDFKSLSSIKLNRIIWSVLFLGKLKPTWLSKIPVDKDGIRILLDYGFIEYNNKSEIVFCHQLIERSFCFFFSNSQNTKNPSLVFIDDDEFLKDLFAFTNRVGKVNLCVENMLLGMHLDVLNTECFHMSLKSLSHSSPRAVMLPLIVSSLLDGLNNGMCTQYTMEFQALYAVSIACQERFDVHMAADYMKELVVYEQKTYKEKISAKSDMLLFFKNYVFQIPIAEKYCFLEWMIDESENFGLSDRELSSFLGWIYNRYSKNLCSEHKFEEAEGYVQKALKIALNEEDFCAAAEAEIEYGNIYAYFDAKQAAKHWKNCADYIVQSNSHSVYYEIYHYGYNILSRLLQMDMAIEVTDEIKKLLEFREKTFLYQKLFIDDIYADYYIIRYLDGECSFDEFKGIVPILVQSKSESYMHTPIFTVLTTYKLFTVYRLIIDVEFTDANIDTTVSLIYELINSNIFDELKLPYSTMILYEIYTFCQKKDNLVETISKELPHVAKNIFCNMQNEEFKKQFEHAISPLSNKSRKVNLLHFNYVF